MGFRYQRIRDRCLLFERRDLIEWRRKYLKRIKAFRSSNAYIVYTDETWIFEGMKYSMDWMDKDAIDNPKWYMNKGWKLNPSPAPSRGKRGIVVGAIGEDGIIEGSFEVWAECGMSDDGDYHRTMDSALFEKWLLDILPAIVKAANGRQPVLVLDNAPYHSKLIEKVPSPSSKKQEIVDFLVDHGIAADLSYKKKELLVLFDLYADSQGGRQALKKYRIDTAAAAHGVTVLRLPAYHCTLNPIEFFWGWLKSKLAKQSKKKDKMDDFRQHALDYVKDMDADLKKSFYRCTITKEDEFIRKEGITVVDVDWHGTMVVPLEDDDDDDDHFFDSMVDEPDRDLHELDVWGFEEELEELEEDVNEDNWDEEADGLQSQFVGSAFTRAARRVANIARPLPTV